MIAPTYTTGNVANSPETNGNARCFTAREAERLPYERTGDWADLPMGGAGMGGFAAHLISQKSKIFDSFSSRRSLGRCRASKRILHFQMFMLYYFIVKE